MYRKVQICGERCSGTNYLQKLLQDNFHVDIVWEMGWKHFPKRARPGRDIYVICITRNVHDWVGSMLKHRHHIPQGVKDPLRTPWTNEHSTDTGAHTLLGHRYYFFETMFSIRECVHQWVDYDWLTAHATQWMKTLPLDPKPKVLSNILSQIDPNVSDTHVRWTKSSYPRVQEGLNEEYESWMEGMTKTERGVGPPGEQATR